MFKINVQTEPFDAGTEIKLLKEGRAEIGAITSFIGFVRDFNERPEVRALTLEHYPGMTELQLSNIAPFWKKEHTSSGDYWVNSRVSDTQAADKWRVEYD